MAARRAGEQSGSVRCTERETCFVFSGQVLVLVDTSDMTDHDIDELPTFSKGNSPQGLWEVFCSVLKEPV